MPVHREEITARRAARSIERISKSSGLWQAAEPHLSEREESGLKVKIDVEALNVEGGGQVVSFDFRWWAKAKFGILAVFVAWETDAYWHFASGRLRLELLHHDLLGSIPAIVIVRLTASLALIFLFLLK